MYNNHSVPVLLSLSIFFVLFVSGCTFPGSSSVVVGNGGIVIENFEVDFAKIYAGENFKIQMKMRNDGLVDAVNTHTELYNIQADGTSEDISCTLGQTCMNGVILLGADIDRGTVGESKICIWDCKAPINIQKGLSVTFNPSVRLYYGYQTHVIKSINIVSQDELRSIESQGKALPSETVSTSGGPVTLDIVVNGPIRYWQEENRVVFPININIQNSGSGVVFHINDDKPEYWNKLTLIFDTMSENVKLSCGDNEGATKLEVELWKGKSTTLSCEVDIAGLQNMAGLVQKNLKFTAEYGYFVDSSVQVEVTGRDINN